jgi:hypothetical protein
VRMLNMTKAEPSGLGILRVKSKCPYLRGRCELHMTGTLEMNLHDERLSVRSSSHLESFKLSRA